MNHSARQAFQVLRLGFTVAPIIAGLDKFLGLLTNWDKYLPPAVSGTLGVAPHTFMLVVGAIEIVAGVLVAVNPRFGGYLVSAWLCLIIVNLLMVGGFLDVALRDLGLAMGAFALAKLAEAEAVARVGVPAAARA
jgi:uncharacterized membrane protein YphA (DoxX/SURF4 family)